MVSGYEVWVSTAVSTSFVEVDHTDAEVDAVRKLVLARDDSTTPTTSPLAAPKPFLGSPDGRGGAGPVRFPLARQRSGEIRWRPCAGWHPGPAEATIHQESPP